MEQKKVTLLDIANKSGLSKSAVSLALKGSAMVSEKTRKRVGKIADSLGYVRNELVSSMMSSIKRSSVESFAETIALINGNTDEFALTNHPTLPKYCIGIRSEAKRLGYSINEFWMHDPKLNSERISRVFKSRGIRGGIILGHSFGNVFPPAFKSIWKNFYFISVGIKTYNPILEMVSADHYAITYQALTHAVSLGYRRPALVLENHIDELVDGRFIAGFTRAQMNLSSTDIIAPFTASDKSADYAENLYSWVVANKPDAILYLLDSTREILSAMPRKRHGKFRLIQLERRGYVPNWMGMEQNNDIVGTVAMRRLADMLSRPSSRVAENAGMVTLVPPTWISASSEKEKKV